MVDLEQFRNPNGYYNCVALRKAAGMGDPDALFFALFGSTDELATPPILPGEWQEALEEADRRNAELKHAREAEFQARLDEVPDDLVEQVLNGVHQDCGGTRVIRPTLGHGGFARDIEDACGLDADLVYRAASCRSADSETFADLMRLAELNPAVYRVVMARKKIDWVVEQPEE